MTYDYESHHADDATYIGQDLETTTITLTATAETLTAEVAAAASAILTAGDLQTATTRAAQQLTGTLAEAVLTDLVAALTRIGAAHDWPEAAELRHGWSGMNIQLIAYGYDGDVTCAINIHADGVNVYCEHATAAVACPAELLAVLLAAR